MPQNFDLLQERVCAVQDDEAFEAQEVAYQHIKKSIYNVQNLSRYQGLRAALGMLAFQVCTSPCYLQVSANSIPCYHASICLLSWECNCWLNNSCCKWEQIAHCDPHRHSSADHVEASIAVIREVLQVQELCQVARHMWCFAGIQISRASAR